MHEVLDFLNRIPAGTWEIILASGVISPFLQSIKHWLSVQSDKVMFTLLVLASGVVATGHYLLVTPSTNPSIIALQTALLSFMTQPFYFFLVKPLYKSLTDGLSKEAKSAIEPVGGIPMATPETVATTDFTI